MHQIRGPFVQEDYGFSVDAPFEISRYVTDGGDANHGVLMILGEARTIVAYPEYTDPDLGNTKPCRSGQFPWEESATRTESKLFLGNQAACFVRFSRGDVVWAVAQAKGDDRGQGIMYTLLLTTTQRSLQTDLAIFQRVASTFKRIPIDP